MSHAGEFIGPSLFVLLLLCCATGWSQDQLAEKQHAETITAAEHEYVIRMGGTLDGVNTRDPIGYQTWSQAYEPMQLVRLENVGDTVVVNPWLFTNDRGHWRTCRELVDYVTAPYDDEVERAIALWWWETRHRFHATTSDAENNDPVKVWNIYGHTLCGNDAYVMADVWRTAGFRTRAPRIQGHCITEVWADGGWRLLDGDENIITLLRDNETYASQADILRDHDLMKRNHTYGILRADSRQTDEFSASLYALEQQPHPDQDRRSHLGHEMKFTLRPGEALVWSWEKRGKMHGSDERVTKMAANGYWEFEPRLTLARVAEDAMSSEGLAQAEGGLRAANGAANLVYRIRAPYVIVGGKLHVAGALTQGKLRLALSRDGEEWTEVASLEQLTTEASVIDLDDLFPRDQPACYEYLVRAQFEGDITLTSLRVVNDLQMAPLCMPYLELGENRIKYTDETQGPRSVTLTHSWVENSATRPPAAAAAPIFPPDGASLDRTQFTFRWQPARDPDGDDIADYEFQLSRYPDMRWPMSPNFFKLISKTANKGTASFDVPYRGLLNPGTTYYWQVRARDANRVWGPWSEVWSFQPGGPGIPLHLARRVDPQTRTIAISWRDNPQGEKPAKYKVYGSNEKGFTVSDEPYQVWIGNQEPEQGWRTWPGNLLGETTGRSMQVVGPSLTAENANKAFYRVVAVDENGVESGPSDYIAMPRPFIYTAPVTTARVGQPYSYAMHTIFSLGDLRCRTSDPKHLYNAKFWDVEHPQYALEEGPAWLKMNAVSGKVKAAIEGVGEDVQEFTLSVAQ